ncbi:MAG: ATP-binding cassette domain-containing protein, partial [Bacteroidota bacterium]|nr:ATP-binding cassette domain-containing protein [Bacteroidota bacterium]
MEIDGVIIKDFSDKKLAQLRNEKIGFIFQSFHLINDLNVVDNVELPLLYRRGLSAKQRKAFAIEALGKVGLSARTSHYPNQLSGGQRQRVAIARAIAGTPEIILADEPTGNLDSAMANEIMQILIDLNEQGKTTIVMVTHDENMAAKTKRLVRFFDGQQVAQSVVMA